MSARHRDFVRDDLGRAMQLRIGRVEGDETILGMPWFDDFEGRTIWVTDAHDFEQCPFADGDELPMLVSSPEPLVVPDLGAISRGDVPHAK